MNSSHFTNALVSSAPGRLPIGAPIAIIDIGSNSVRLVAYEGLTRAPTPIFNEKVLCGLGRGVVTTGRLNDDAMDKALRALARFRTLCMLMEVGELRVLATAAAREASNGPEFLAAAEAAIGQPIMLLSGKREAELSALGVVSAINNPDGVVGDMGGGSLELIDVKGDTLGRGTTLALGGLALMDASGKSLRQALKIVRNAFENAPPLDGLRGRTFYAVGGTWRALAKLHMSQRNHPLMVMHNYKIPARDASDFAALLERADTDTLTGINVVNAQRRPLLAYGAVVLDEIIRRARPEEIIISVAGVREGLLYESLDAQERAKDPLIAAAQAFNVLRSRSPAHAEDLHTWIDAFMESTQLEVLPDEKRLRHAACLLADIAWRAHPDYRGVQAFDLVANASFTGVDHPGRAFIALATAIRHIGLNETINPQIGALVSARMQDRARILGAAMRVAYIVSAAMPGVLPRTPMRATKDKVVLNLPADLSALASERLHNRLRSLARVIGREPQLVV